jgi:hypothetical protein
MLIDARDLRLLTAQGLSALQIARELKVSPQRVWRSAAVLGIEIFRRKVGRPRKAIVGHSQVPPHQPDPRIAVVAQLAAEGKTRVEIMTVVGVCRKTLVGLERAAGVKIKHASQHSAGKPVDERAEKMVSMYRQGLTLEKIGETFDITRERVRQILKKHGITRLHGGQTKSKESSKAAAQAKQDAHYLTRYGITFARWKELRGTGLLTAYRNQENAAKCRGIHWGLTIAQWLDVWETSGKLAQRGRGKGKYCMSRIKDEGGYVVGNVHIQLCEVNSFEALQKYSNKNKVNRGVWCLLPGLSKPWLAKYGKVRIGFYATEEEAVAARAAYMQANPKTCTRGRGYAVISGGKSPKYQVMVARKYVGLFDSPEEALTARARFIEQSSPHPLYGE